MRFAIVCAPAGSGLTGGVELLIATLRDQGLKVDSADVEQQLLAGHPEFKDMLDYTWSTPRSQVIADWRSAFQSAVASLDPDSDIRIISCHLTLLSRRRSETYSPVDVSLIHETGEVTHVLLLIDDIYDMYLRLSAPGRVFNWRRWVRSHVQGAWAAEEREDATPSFSPGEEAMLRLEARTTILGSLLSWRRSETIIAENLATQLRGSASAPRTRFLMFGVKQFADIAAQWLLGGTEREGNQRDRPTVYLSHPISRPRRELRDAGEGAPWPPFVEQYNEVPAALLDEGALAIMPTAIDEYRFVAGAASEGDVISPSLPRLSSRWPFPRSESQDRALLYVPPSEADWTSGAPTEADRPDWEHHIEVLRSAPEFGEVLGVNDAVDETTLVPLVRGLRSAIEVEVPSRDHLLVAWSNSFLVYRPFYGKGKFSGGVHGEIEHWDLAAKTDAARRAAFVHFREDIELGIIAWVDQHESPRAKAWLEGALAKITAEYLGAMHYGEHQIMDAGKGQFMGDWFDPGAFADPDKAWNDIADARRAAAERHCLYMLTDVRFSTNQVGVWIVSGIEEQPAACASLASFLAGRGPGLRERWKVTFGEILATLEGSGTTIESWLYGLTR